MIARLLGLAALTVTLAGCLPSGGGNNGGGNNGGGNNGGGNNGGGACVTGDDCSINYCNCTDGGVVNARRCDNSTCAPASAVCPDACQQFGTEWDGTVTELPEDDAGSDTGFDTGSSDASGPQCLGGALGDTECGRCLAENCCTELENCFASDACTGYLQCVNEGGSEGECSEQNPGGKSIADPVISCQQTRCPVCR
jgi:hypothetical protein